MSESESTQKTQKPPRRQAAWNKVFIYFLINITLTVLLVLAIGGYFLKQMEKNSAKKLRDNRQYVTAMVEGLQLKQEKNAGAINDLQKNKIDPRTQHLAYAKYLTKLALTHVLYLQDIAGGLQLYRQAKNMLQLAHDPAAQQLLGKINDDIDSLKNLRPVDKQKIYKALDQVMSELMQLSDPATSKKEAEPDKAKNESVQAALPKPSSSWWQRILNTLSQLFHKMFLIQHIDVKRPALLSVDQLMLVKQNMLLKLQQAQLALSLNQYENYQHAVQTTIQWLTTYYPSPQVAALIQSLQRLRNEKVSIKLPKLHTQAPIVS